MEKEIIEKFDKHISWSSKLAPYKLQYKCDNDCQMAGCPSHIATLEISHATDTFHIDFGDGTSIGLDGTRMAIIQDFINRFEPI